MARLIVKRDNGLWNLWSTVVDDYLFDSDMTIDQFEKEYTNMRTQEIVDETSAKFKDIRENKRNSFTKECDL